MIRSVRAAATVLALAAGYAAMLAVDLPGHLTYDSVVQLHEGRFQVRDTWAPAIYGVVLGFFDRFVPGTALYVIASGLLFFGSLASLVRLRPPTSWAPVVVTLLMAASPLVLIYQGIVWKDVLFANCAVAGCICLAHAARAWDRRLLRWTLLLAALLLLALAGLVRQNGLVVALLAAFALAWTARGGGAWSSLRWGLGGLIAVVALSQAMSAAVEPPGGAEEAAAKGVRIVQQYDLGGAAARDPTLQMPAIAALNPRAPDVIRAEAARVYTPERVDTFSSSPALMAAFRSASRDAVASDWRRLILDRPDLYLRQRLEVFRALVAPAAVERCLPVTMGVYGPAEKLAALGIAPRASKLDAELFTYSKRLFATPVFSHLTYAAAATLAALLLLLRRDPEDVPMAALMLGALAFTATFLIISLACDLRYLYLLDLAGMVGVFYLSLDPRLRRRGKSSPSA